MAKKQTKAVVHDAALSLLIRMGTDVLEGKKAKAAAQAAETQGYALGIEARITCDSYEQWSLTVDTLEAQCRKNVDGIADRLDPKCKKDKPSKKDQEMGYTHTVPFSISYIKSLVKFCHENEIKLVDTQGNARSITFLKDARKKKREANSAKEEREQIASLKGDDKLKYEIFNFLEALSAARNTVQHDDIVKLHKAVERLAKQYVPEPEESENADAADALQQAAA